MIEERKLEDGFGFVKKYKCNQQSLSNTKKKEFSVKKWKIHGGWKGKEEKSMMDHLKVRYLRDL